MKTLEKKPTRAMRNNPSRLYSPWDRYFRNDFLDFWDGDMPAETIPSINISEEKEQYKLEMAAPGLKKEDFNIEVDGNVMTISCEKESEIRDGENGNGKENNGYSRKEYSYSCFSRSFTVPEHADANHIVAKYSNGILNLNIPKRPEAQKNKSQKIAIQ